MTTQELRELDTAVAEQVMGWTQKRLPNRDGGGHVWVDANGRTAHNGTAYESPDFSPSTDWKFAGEVVEAMRDKGWLPHMDVCDPAMCVPEVAGQWSVSFSRPVCEGRRPDGAYILARLPQSATAPTFPLAACRAALAAASETGDTGDTAKCWHCKGSGNYGEGTAAIACPCCNGSGLAKDETFWVVADTAAGGPPTA